MKPSKWLPLAWVLLLAAFAPTRAEVSAKVDSAGSYMGMVFKYNASNATPRIWSVTTVAPTRRPLNPFGDAIGDLAPSVLENPAQSSWPWAIWSRRDGGDYDLVYSKWDGTGWGPIFFVTCDAHYNDLEPRFGFNSSGRPYLVWWSDEDAVGAVWFSIFLETRWMTPILVSDQGVDSRHPSIVIDNDNLVTVSFATQGGSETHLLSIPDTDNIRDDVDPKLRSQIYIY